MKLFRFGGEPKPDPEEERSRIIREAEEQRESILREAIAKRDELIAQTLSDRETIIREAEEQKTAILQEAEEKSRSIIRKAEVMQQEAERKAEAIVHSAQEKREQLETQAIAELREQKHQLEEEIRELELKADAFSSDPWEEFRLTSAEYEEKAKLIQVKVAELIHNGRAAENVESFYSDEQIRNYQQRYDQICGWFCAEADVVIILAKQKNFGVANRKIFKAYKDINKSYWKDNIQLSSLLLDLKIQQCIAVYMSKSDKK